MIRSATVLALCLTTGPVFAETLAQKQARCSAMSGITATAVMNRTKGADADTTKEMLTSGNQAVEAKYVPAVSHLVDWVYTLEQDQLTDEAPTSFEQSCLKFQ